jgi:hypothetical protein
MNSIDLTNTKKEETKMSLQFDYRGNFRIVHNPPGAKHFVASEWKPYTSIAVLVHEGRTYIAGSVFGLLPQDETVFEVTSVPTSIDKSKEWTDQGGMDMHALRGCPFCSNHEPCSYIGSETQKKTLARKEV